MVKVTSNLEKSLKMCIDEITEFKPAGLKLEIYMKNGVINLKGYDDYLKLIGAIGIKERAVKILSNSLQSMINRYLVDKYDDDYDYDYADIYISDYTNNRIKFTNHTLGVHYMRLLGFEDEDKVVTKENIVTKLSISILPSGKNIKKLGI